jgi:hypothetical protein
MPRQPTLASQILNEPLNIGGEWTTRARFTAEMLAAGHERRLIDFFLFCHEQRRERDAAAEVPA